MKKANINLLQFLLLLPVPWVFVLTYLIGSGLQLLFPINIHLDVMFKIGILFFIIGAIIAAWGLIIFHKAGTTTVPGEISATLVTTGPYHFTRTPMYAGLTLAYLGEAGILGQIWPIIVLPLLFVYLNWMVIPIEEARLKETFENKYEQYCLKVHRWI